MATLAIPTIVSMFQFTPSFMHVLSKLFAITNFFILHDDKMMTMGIFPRQV